MKTKHALRKIAFVVLLALFQNSFMKAQISPCPFTIINGFNCDISVFVEFRDANCGTMCPWAAPVLLNPGSSVQAGDAACCAAGIYDMIFFLVDIDGQPVGTPWPFVELSTGAPCAGGGPATSGPTPPTVSCPAPASWNMNINAAAGTVIIN